MRQEIAEQHSELPRHVELRMALARAAVRQYVVADRVGISESLLSRILSGRKDADGELLDRIEAAITELAAA